MQPRQEPWHRHHATSDNDRAKHEQRHDGWYQAARLWLALSGLILLACSGNPEAADRVAPALPALLPRATLATRLLIR